MIIFMLQLYATLYFTDDESTDIHTIEEAVDKIGFGVFQVLISLYSGAVLVIIILWFIVGVGMVYQIYNIT